MRTGLVADVDRSSLWTFLSKMSLGRVEEDADVDNFDLGMGIGVVFGSVLLLFAWTGEGMRVGVARGMVLLPLLLLGIEGDGFLRECVLFWRWMSFGRVFWLSVRLAKSSVEMLLAASSLVLSLSE